MKALFSRVLAPPNALPSPVFRWPGGKRRLLRDILALLPAQFGTYYEPFLGGAAVFLGLMPARAFLSDANPELINIYQQIKEDPQALLKTLAGMENSEAEYYRVRGSSLRSPSRQAARLIYLINLSFNGIYRVNSQGGYNVPYGQNPMRQIVDPQNMLRVHKALRDAKLSVEDFEEATKDAKEGDLVYFDPPYTVAHNKNGFVHYNANLFSWEDQLRLANHSRMLQDRGVFVVVSNADHTSIRALYPTFKPRRVYRTSGIAASSEKRQRISELLLCSWETDNA